MEPRDHGLKESSGAAYHPIAPRKGPARTNRNKSRATRARKSRWWPIPRSTVSKALCYASVGLIPVVLLLWLPLDIPKLKNTNIFEGSPIGGRLTLIQAKALDFVSSAVLAPFILAALHLIMSGIPVYTLVEASATTPGSFDVFKLWTLCSSRSGRRMALAILTLLAAFAKSFLSNIIAYEEFMQPVDATPVQLRLLAGPSMSSTSEYQADSTHFDVKLNSTVDDFWVASHDQRREFAMQTTSVLQQVAWQNSNLSLNSSVYVAVNVTTAELSAVAGSVIGLHDVRAVRATIECCPYSPSSVKYVDWSGIQNAGLPAPRIELTLDNWTANVPAPLSVFKDGGSASISNSLDFLAYNMSADSIYIGSVALISAPLIQRNWTKNNTVPLATPFGALQATRHNLTENANGTCDEGYVCEYLVWGLVCSIHQQQGLLNLARGTAGQKWTIGSARWELTEEVHPKRLRTTLQ
ncbi:hypothetical protein PV08_11301 [Exophiala spinifera]|uniref:Uncharacterized protein n=1 Tax=Exophiala spinifera TaxID=91928 RepID=A0A0D2BG48_9EURO|nr:uncharacterized protein PV08_11301 [Exophiala spinifera]KIW10339.1 hypothetical protein PV08_11301 [Exophiala spinifera]